MQLQRVSQSFDCSKVSEIEVFLSCLYIQWVACMDAIYNERKRNMSLHRNFLCFLEAVFRLILTEKN